MKNTALVLTGGGARSAYQVGVLKAISDMMPDLSHPFPIICGASAGAINAVGLAATGDIFRHSVTKLEELWSNLTSNQVYKSDLWSMTRRTGSYVKTILGNESASGPSSLLDNAPLWKLLEQHLNMQQLEQAIEEEKLRAVCVTACGYRSGQSVSFFEAKEAMEEWHAGQRLGKRTKLEIAHLMASSAIPTIFPPIKVGNQYFGDGVLRNMATLSPAVHLGAKRILVIGVSANRICSFTPKTRRQHFPTTAQVLENMLNGSFIDVIENDIDRALQINQLLNLIPDEVKQEKKLNLNPIDLEVISPSEAFDDIAARHLDELPFPIRKVLGQNAADSVGAASLASYLIFEGPFLRELIKLGYGDAKAHASQLQRFFSAD